MQIYTDGSCIGNPGPGGWAAILLDKENKKPMNILKGNVTETTNNRMEMIAVIEALRFIQAKKYTNEKIKLFSDSNLVIQTLNKGWKRKANIDLWEELDEYNQDLEIEFVWVKAHAENKWNEECDKIALQEAMKAERKLINGEVVTRTPEKEETKKQESLF